MDKAYFESKKAEIKAFREKMKADGKVFFQNNIKEIFEKHPELVSFSWHHSTPHTSTTATRVRSARVRITRN